MLKNALFLALKQSIPLLSCFALPVSTTIEDIIQAVRTSAPDLCFIGVATEGNLDLILRLNAAYPRLDIIAVLDDENPELILRCLRSGATGFLVPPFQPEQVQLVLEKSLRTLRAIKPPARRSKVIGIMSVKGSCGATTIACNLVHQWKRQGIKKVLLADLDPLTGVIGFLLKVQSNHSFLDVLRRAGDMDHDVWKGIVSNVAGVDVLPAPETVFDGELSEIVDASPIFEFARQNYDLILADAGKPYGGWSLSQAAHCDEMVLVSGAADEAAILKALNYLEAHKLSEKVQIVINRYNEKIFGPKEQLESRYQRNVFHWLPSDWKTCQNAALKGQQVPSSCALGKSLGQLAANLSGYPEPVKESSLSLGSLWALATRLGTKQHI